MDIQSLSDRDAALQQALFYVDRAVAGNLTIHNAVLSITRECLPLYDLTKDEANLKAALYLDNIVQLYFDNMVAFLSSEPIHHTLSNEEMLIINERQMKAELILWRASYE